ncbi:MAG: DUF3515 domain-containing protein [Actinomycetes bacterium]
MPRGAPLSRALAAVLLVAGAAGCSGSDPAAGPVEVPPPPAAGSEVDTSCRALLDALPHDVGDGVARRPVEPDTGRTAAWGEPPVVVECGVEAPERDEPPFVVNGVAFTTRDVGSATRWTTYGRTVRAAVTIPDDYSGGDVVVRLTDALDRALPQDPTAPPLVDLPTPEPS